MGVTLIHIGTGQFVEESKEFLDDVSLKSKPLIYRVSCRRHRHLLAYGETRSVMMLVTSLLSVSGINPANEQALMR